MRGVNSAAGLRDELRPRTRARPAVVFHYYQGIISSSSSRETDSTFFLILKETSESLPFQFIVCDTRVFPPSFPLTNGLLLLFFSRHHKVERNRISYFPFRGSTTICWTCKSPWKWRWQLVDIHTHLIYFINDVIIIIITAPLERRASYLFTKFLLFGKHGAVF